MDVADQPSDEDRFSSDVAEKQSVADTTDADSSDEVKTDSPHPASNSDPEEDIRDVDGELLTRANEINDWYQA